MTSAGAGAVTMLPSLMLSNERRRLVDLAAKSRLPAMYFLREFVDAGGLMAYGVNGADLTRRAATYVDKILKGAKPADLPVEQPTKFELVINLKAAKALGLEVPPLLIAQADELLECVPRLLFTQLVAHAQDRCWHDWSSLAPTR